MARKRIPTGLSGVLAVDKPAGMTSHDVVTMVRRVTGERRVGHTGTLDPLATGLLLVCVGPATRLADYLMAGIKTYEARICFGTATTTDDSEGEIIRTSDAPRKIEDAELAADTLQGLVGELLQVPPAFSAIKKDGVTSYKAARRGEAVVLEPRQVHLYDAKLLAIDRDYWNVQLTVSKGFYVRSFARDLGEHLESAAHLGALRRTASGNVSVQQACQLSSLAPGEPLPFIDVVAALDLPVIEVDAAGAERVSNGMTLTAQGVAQGQRSLASVVQEDRLLALYEVAGASGFAQPKIVIPTGCVSRRVRQGGA